MSDDDQPSVAEPGDPVVAPAPQESEPVLVGQEVNWTYWERFVGCPVPAVGAAYKVDREEWDTTQEPPVRTIYAYTLVVDHA